MKIDNISTQNFNGRFLFLKTGKLGNEITEDIQKYAPFLHGKDIASVQKEISSRPYDLYISKSDDLEGFLEINASAKLKNLLLRKEQGNIRPVLVMEDKSDRIPAAASEAIYKYDKSSEYYEDAKTENPLKLLFNKLFKKS